MGHNTSVPISSHNQTPIKPDKGVYKGSCNRIRCQKPDAEYYAKSTQRYYCKSCAEVLNKYNPPSEDMVRAGIAGALCVSADDPSHPYFNDRGKLFVPHEEDVRQVLKNIFETAGGIPKGEFIVKTVMTWSRSTDPKWLNELIIDEVQLYNEMRLKKGV